MAHVLVAFGDRPEALRVQTLLEGDGQTVTVATEFWQALGLLRSSLHPLGVVFGYEGDDIGDDVTHDADKVHALVAHFHALHRHAYVQVAWWQGPLPPPLQALAEAVILETLPGPCDAAELCAAIHCAAARLALPGRLGNALRRATR